jgi:thiol-disulfide isomerase/thioredoxin
MALVKPIAHLEDQDFDKQGNLIVATPAGQPVVVMVQASWCHFCSEAKPAFQEFANMTKGKVFCATIQADGDRPSEQALGKRIAKIIPGFRGFPDYALFVNGKRVNKQIAGRGVADLQAFASQ